MTTPKRKYSTIRLHALEREKEESENIVFHLAKEHYADCPEPVRNALDYAEAVRMKILKYLAEGEQVTK